MNTFKFAPVFLFAAACGTWSLVAAEETPAKVPENPPLANVLALEAGKAVDEVELIDDAALAAKRPKITGKIDKGFQSLVDIECDEATLADILRQFRKTTSANIISDDSTNLQKRVSVSLKRVPWLEGLQSILGSRGFRLEERDGIFRVKEDDAQIPVNTRTFALNHASAKDLATLFNESYAPKDAKGTILKPIATSFSGANVVVVTATDKILSDCETIIKAVDKAVAQIYIEARFIEVSSEAMHKFGVQWDQLESWGGSLNGMKAGMEYNNGRRNDGGTAALAAPGAGRDADDMAWRNARGFQGQLSVDDFRLALSAFEKMQDAKIFSNPKVIVSNGKEAMVDMTKKFPNVKIETTYVSTGQQQTPSVSMELEEIPGEKGALFSKEVFFSWGIELKVKPRISPDGLITVEISPTISYLDKEIGDEEGFYEPSTGTSDASGASSQAKAKYPVLEVKRLKTEFTMKDGATAVIGGLSKTEEGDIDSGIPYLRKIPWIGSKLFGWKSRGLVQKEIVIFVTLGIANPAELPKDAGLPKNAVVGREFVTGTQKEPGDRATSAAEVLKLDMRPLDNREDLKPGEVSIKPVED